MSFSTTISTIRAGVPVRVPVRLLLWATFVLAALPLTGWWTARVFAEHEGEPQAVAALLLAVALSWSKEPGQCPVASGCPSATPGRQSGWLASVLALLPGAVLGWLPGMPSLLAALVVLAGLGWVLGATRRPALAGALLLSLPLWASVEFFVGHWLRRALAVGVEFVLAGVGLPVGRSGAVLSWRGVPCGVDPACAGLSMLAGGALLVVVLAGLHRLDWRRSVALAALGLGLLLLANGLRIAVLLPLEGGGGTSSGWHEFVGLTCFAPAAFALVRLAGWLRDGQPAAVRQERRNSVRDRSGHSFWPLRPGWVVLPLLALVVGAALRAENPLETMRRTEPWHWPSEFRGRELVPLPADATERALAERLPGVHRRFLAGDETVIVRRLDRASRAAHGAATCFQAAGWHRRGLPEFTDAEGQCWSRTRLDRGGELLLVEERFAPVGGGAGWTEPGAWFWAALLDPGAGPWEQWIVLRRLD